MWKRAGKPFWFPDGGSEPKRKTISGRMCSGDFGRQAAENVGGKVIKAVPEELTEKYQNMFSRMDMAIGGR